MSIAKIRTEIDAIDKDILNLLKKRSEAVAKVGKIKSSNPEENKHSIIRPAREALMLRDVMKNHGSKLSDKAIAAIWRLIISASIAIEETSKISLNPDAIVAATEYFGGFIPKEIHKNTKEILDDLNSGKATVAILPLNDESKFSWWKNLSRESKIFAMLPLMDPDPTHVCVANIKEENTDDDVFFYRTEISDKEDFVFAKEGKEKFVCSFEKNKYENCLGSCVPAEFFYK